MNRGTSKMKCQDIQKLIIEQSDAAISPNQKRIIEDHLVDCPQCKQFFEDLIRIRCSIQEQPFPTLSEKIQSQTLIQCHRILELNKKGVAANSPVPKWLWIALGICLAIAIFWLSTLGKQFLENKNLSPGNIHVLLFILQNIIMLVLTPVLMKQYQQKQKKKSLLKADIRVTMNHI